MSNKMTQSELIELYDLLHTKLENPEFCNSKIEECMNRECKDSFELVHIMNALAPIKDKLPLWKPFIQYCINTFREIGRPTGLIRVGFEKENDYI
jgi:hypothetical protein